MSAEGIIIALFRSLSHAMEFQKIVGVSNYDVVELTKTGDKILG